MGAFVITIFILQLLKIGTKLTHLLKDDYPRLIKIEHPGIELLGLLVASVFAIWAGVLIF